MLTAARFPAPPDAPPHPLDAESRALWHLELLGCFGPEDAQLVPPWAQPVSYDSEWDDGTWDDDDDWGPDDLSCTHCGGEGFRQVDYIWWDDCDEFGEGPCTSCRGTGLRKHQWVF